MKKIPAIIHQFWIGGPMPDRIVDWVKSINAANPDWHHIIWCETNVEQLGLPWHELKTKSDSPCGYSDIVRRKALLDFGGIWCDADIEAKQSFEPLRELGAFGALQEDGLMCDAFIGCTPRHPWMQWQWDNIWPFTIAPIGVYRTTAAPREGVTLLAPHLVYPFSWTTPLEQRAAHADSIVVHHWEGSWIKKPAAII